MQKSYRALLSVVVALAASSSVVAAPRVIEEVIVTSQKTAQSLQDVPISVSAMSGETLREANISTLAEMAVQLPNVNFASEGQRNDEVYIRGFGTNPFNPSFESSVGLVQDEVFYGRATYFSEVPFDVERIEVLRGPQGTLFGKNTVAGVFNIASRTMSDEFQFYGEAGVSENAGRKFEMGAGGMLTDRFGLRVSGVSTRTDGQLYNTTRQEQAEAPDYRAARLKMLFLLSDSAELELLALHAETDTPYWFHQLYQLDDDTRDYLQQFDPQVEGDAFNHQSSTDYPGALTKDTDTYMARLNVDFGEALGLAQLDMTVILATSEMLINQTSDLDASPADIARMKANDDYQQQTLEWRFSGSAESLLGLGSGVDFVGGLFVFQSDFVFDGGFMQGEDTASFVLTPDAAELAGDLALAIPALYAATLTQENQQYQLDFDRQAESIALFGQFTWYLTDSLSVTPGLRLNRETKQADVAGTMSCDSIVPVVGAAVPCTFGLVLGANTYAMPDQERTAEDISPKLAIAYAPSDEINYYLTMSQGFKSGGYNALSFSGEQLTYDDEVARTIEIGSKGRFFDQSLSVNVALFQTEFDDLQVLAFNGVFFDVRNAASAVSRGLEMDWQWLTPWDALSISGALGWLDSTYESYPGAPAPVYEGQDAEQDLAGQQIANAPELSVTLSPKLEIPIGDEHGVQTVLDIIHNGDKYTDTDLDRNSLIPANTKYNLRVSFGHVSAKYSVTLGVKNLTDEKTLNVVTDSPFFPGTYFAYQANGREVYGAVRVDF